MSDRDDPTGPRGGAGAALDDLGRLRGIRCPRCGWRPRARDRWWCHCGHSWNTFDTQGRCPGCGHQWLETACPGCHRWSLHADWYER
ncbi:MAG: hypothetical protein HY909_01905 [Deltaproteobacteria bacterium]|nr:hypothetical protein [Deltaproteobacteria bacterium]